MTPREMILIGAAGVLAVAVVLDPFGFRGGGSGLAEPVERPRSAGPAVPDTRPLEEGGPFLERFESFTATRDRPLFSPDRRRAQSRPQPQTQQPTTPRPQPPARPPNFLVMGVALGPDDIAVADIQAGGEVHSVAEGDQLQNWRIRRIYIDRVVVERDERRFELPVGPPDED
jgi:general secretion pathway protein N